jgi:catechol 2,3-dioxygenase-like lactoylglutathione lyase family enzyme
MTDRTTDPITARTTTPAARACVKVGHTAVNTPDLDRFRRFYEDVLGLRLVVVNHATGAPFRRLGAFTDRDGESMVLLAFEVPGYASGLADDVIGRRGRLDHLAFYAADDTEFEEIIERLVDAGASSGTVTVLGPVRSVLFVDPDGAHHNLQITEPGWRPDQTAEVIDAGLLARLQGSRTELLTGAEG